MITTNSDNPMKDYYLQTWKTLLAEFLGWSEAQMLEWADATGKLEYLSDPDDLLYHQTPLYWATNLLVPTEFKERLSSSELGSLKQQIMLAFNDNYNYNFPLDIDWKPYKARVAEILEGHYALSQ